MRVGLVGGRDYHDWNTFKRLTDRAHARFRFTHVYSGGAQGADALAYRWAIHRGLDFTCFPPVPEDGFPKAFFIRNTRIVTASEMIIAFPDPSSRGTYDSLQKAYDQDKPAYIVIKGVPSIWQPTKK